MRSIRTQTWRVIAAWLLFFTPALLPGLSASALGHLLLAAWCFAPVLLVRPLLPLVLGGAGALGLRQHCACQFFWRFGG